MLLRPEYLSQNLDHPLPTKDGDTLRTVLDARMYMLALSRMVTQFMSMRLSHSEHGRCVWPFRAELKRVTA
jgi:hypothetical protein